MEVQRDWKLRIWGSTALVELVDIKRYRMSDTPLGMR
jgi:hypothetical protein